MIELIKAPFSDELITKLEEYQADESFHPYTCVCGYSLIPTREGWICDECSYTQTWCHNHLEGKQNDL